MTRSKTELVEAIHIRTGRDKEELEKLQKFKLCMILDELRDPEDDETSDLSNRIGASIKIKTLKKE